MIYMMLFLLRLLPLLENGLLVPVKGLISAGPCGRHQMAGTNVTGVSADYSDRH